MKDSLKKEVGLNWKPLLTIDKNIKNLIDYAHKTVGNTEWCGYVIYEDTGSIEQKNLTINIKGIFFLDIGEPAYTEYTADESIMDLFEQYPGIEEGTLKYGLIHTHLNYGAVN